MGSLNQQDGILRLTANILTVSRLFFAAIFMVLFCEQDFFPGMGDRARFIRALLALAIFFVALLSDLFDGRLARRCSGESVFGQFMDPIADKVLVASCLIAFVGHPETSFVKAWAVTLIIGREFVVTGVRLLAAAGGQVLAAERLGKHKTGWQMGYITWVLSMLMFKRAGALFQMEALAMFSGILESMARLGVYVVVLMTLISGGSYLWKNMHLFRSR